MRHPCHVLSQYKRKDKKRCNSILKKNCRKVWRLFDDFFLQISKFSLLYIYFWKEQEAVGKNFCLASGSMALLTFFLKTYTVKYKANNIPIYVWYTDIEMLTPTTLLAVKNIIHGTSDRCGEVFQSTDMNRWRWERFTS